MLVLLFIWLVTWVVSDFGSGKSGIRPFWGNPAKFLAGFGGCQCSWSNTSDNNNAPDVSSGVFAVLISVTWTKNTKAIAVLPFHKFCRTGKQWRSKGSTELYSLFIAADSIVDAVSFVTCIVLWSENKLSPNPAVDLSSKSGQVWLRLIWKQIQFNPASNRMKT